ncbi:MAG: hypothetical protein MI976_05035 [Pseudomonadales bacterium]|nr:hypothetical protein [Pseudomonadales bacterium]
MNIDSYKYLWDGSESGWELQLIDKTEWILTLEFSTEGPTKKEMLAIHSTIPEFKNKKLPEIYKELKGLGSYQVKKEFSNLELRCIVEDAKEKGHNLSQTAHQAGGYLPIKNGNQALLIEDNEILAHVVKKMLENGIKVSKIHVD